METKPDAGLLLEGRMTMGIKVLKFGGSSVADSGQLKKVKAIIEADPDRKYVVVSAPGKRFSDDVKITDRLFKCKQLLDEGKSCDEEFALVIERFNGIASDLGIDVDLKPAFDEIVSTMKTGCSRDYVASRGEHLSAKLIAAYLGYEFVETAGVVLFDSNGKLLDEETNENLKKALEGVERAVIPGFYGSEKGTRNIKVFSRGGSDVTGALVARAVLAEVYENWTDVSGLLAADPRIVKDPMPVRAISYAELRELSVMGASVLHEDAVIPVQKEYIPINIRNTDRPGDPGTIISDAGDTEREISGVSGKKGYTRITMKRNGINKQAGAIAGAVHAADDLDIGVEFTLTSVDTISLVIPDSALAEKKDELIQTLWQELVPDQMAAEEGLSIVAAVGSGLAENTALIAKLISSLGEHDIMICMLLQGSSPNSVLFGVPTAQYDDALRTLHDACR